GESLIVSFDQSSSQLHGSVKACPLSSHTGRHTCTCTYTHAHTHTHTRALTHTLHIHKHTDTHTHTHTDRQQTSIGLSPGPLSPDTVCFRRACSPPKFLSTKRELS